MKAATSYTNPLLSGWRLGGGDIQLPNLMYRAWRNLFYGTVGTLFNVRVYERHNEPATGGVVYICNHQSYLDPILMSMGLRRPMNYMARDSLFRAWGFRHVIRKLNAFPVRRNTADLAALKEAMRRLKNNAQVVVFAEGTRSLDGKIAPLLPGVAMLAQRAATWTVPVVIEGAIEAWPKNRILPRPATIQVQYGHAIHKSNLAGMSSQDLVTMMHANLVDIQNQLRLRLGREPINYD